MNPILTRLGLADHDPQLLHDRRGTTLYRAGDTAVKITSGLMAGREGEILRVLGAEPYRDHGWDGERSWLALRWIDGISLWDALDPAHQDVTPATRHRILTKVGAAVRALADLHAVGWTHGDLQPDHIIFEGDTTHLIDLACAQGPADVPFYVHRGGLAHTTAPEIATAILTSDDHVATTPQADIWSLGASLWWSWTRTTPIAYTDPAARRPQLLADVAAARRADLTSTRPWPFPQLEELIMACLAADPGSRPTAKELASRFPRA
ncbi:protein kinase domain-containing protein [Thermomonospora cellulosilytica]|uniref:Serine/threonine protein kinase n=1 Tax=Thermomonospora cellulosilytica TaxID=1411118 RepID=A0A7W3RAQ2_9ACTN|nr:lipopolysaccharide kinase InaA family protein [Thermomonospora cellulosilytica]MBA9005939.1 serine/threonine protein kinase [Thermomonospora cellulosilytica]